MADFESQQENELLFWLVKAGVDYSIALRLAALLPVIERDANGVPVRLLADNAVIGGGTSELPSSGDDLSIENLAVAVNTQLNNLAVAGPAAFAEPIAIPEATQDGQGVNLGQMNARFAEGVKRADATLVDTTNSTPATAYVIGQNVGGRAVVAGDVILRANGLSPLNGLYDSGTAGNVARNAQLTTWSQAPGLVVYVENGGSWGCTAELEVGNAIGTTALRFVNTEPPAVLLNAASTMAAGSSLDARLAALKIAGPGSEPTAPVRLQDLNAALGGYLPVYTALPANTVGVNGDLAVLKLAGKKGRIVEKRDGAWELDADRSTWEALPGSPSSSDEYALTTAGSAPTWAMNGQAAIWDGTRWRPSARYWEFGSVVPDDVFTGTTTTTTFHTDVIPPRMNFGGARLKVFLLFAMTSGSANTKVIRMKINGTSVYAMTQGADRTLTQVEPMVHWAPSGNSHPCLAIGDNDDGAGNASIGITLTADLSQALTITYEATLGNNADTVRLLARIYQIHALPA